MLEKDFCLKVVRHDFLFISLSIHFSHLEIKKPSQAPSSAQLSTTKREKIPLFHLLKGTLLNAEGITHQITSPLQGMWLSTNLCVFKGKGYVIHWNIQGKEVTLGRCSAPKNYCNHIHWQGPVNFSYPECSLQPKQNNQTKK